MAESVIREWPAGVVTTENKPGEWAYEEGVLLDGMAAQWHATATGADFKYIKDAVDKYVTEDGTIKGYRRMLIAWTTSRWGGRCCWCIG